MRIFLSISYKRQRPRVLLLSTTVYYHAVASLLPPEDTQVKELKPLYNARFTKLRIQNDVHALPVNASIIVSATQYLIPTRPSTHASETVSFRSPLPLHRSACPQLALEGQIAEVASQ